MAMDDRGDDAYRDEEAVNLSQDTLPPVAGRKKKIWGLPRWTLGICLLMVTVVMWTASSFLASVSHSISARPGYYRLLLGGAEADADLCGFSTSLPTTPSPSHSSSPT